MTGATLPTRSRRFVEEYLRDLNATQAAIRAGYSARSAEVTGHRMLRNAKVAAAIAEAQAARSARTEITTDKVLQHWWAIATADPNELMSYRRSNCRHCWGEGFRYQWVDDAEWRRACDRAVKKAEDDGAEDDLMLPSDDGGFGYKVTRPPHPDCPRCDGIGVGYTHFEDTRSVRGPAALLYAGVKQTKDGMEIKVRDQDKAMENVARHLGMFVERREITGKDGGPIAHHVDAKRLTDEELTAIILGGQAPDGSSGGV